MASSVERFTADLPTTGSEREYHSAIVDVVARIAFDRRSAASGFGLMSVLTDGRFASTKLDTETHRIAGSIDENAHLMANLFDGVGEPPAWWKSNYVLRRGASEVVAAARWWVERLGLEPDVVDVRYP